MLPQLCRLFHTSLFMISLEKGHRSFEKKTRTVLKIDLEMSTAANSRLITCRTIADSHRHRSDGERQD